jgi:hypothetical protein
MYCRNEDDTPDEFGTVSMFLDISNLGAYRKICGQFESVK